MNGDRFDVDRSFGQIIPNFILQNADLPRGSLGDGEIACKFNSEVVPNLTFGRPGRLPYANSGSGRISASSS